MVYLNSFRARTSFLLSSLLLTPFLFTITILPAISHRQPSFCFLLSAFLLFYIFSPSPFFAPRQLYNTFPVLWFQRRPRAN